MGCDGVQANSGKAPRVDAPRVACGAPKPNAPAVMLGCEPGAMEEGTTTPENFDPYATMVDTGGEITTYVKAEAERPAIDAKTEGA